MNQPFFHPWVKRGFLLFFSASVCIGLWHGLKTYRFHQSLKELQKSIEDRNYSRTVFLLRSLTDRDPGHPLLLVEQARIYTLLRHPLTGQAWLEALKKNPDNQEYRVAAMLAFIHLNDFKNGAALLDSWPEKERSGSAWHRASMALAFAREDRVAAQQHADALVALEPNSAVARLNQAKIALKDPEKQEAARQTLQTLSHEPAQRHEAFKTLIQDALSRKEFDRVATLTGALAAFEETNAEDEILLLESRTAASLPISDDDIQRAWSKSKGSSQFLTRLIGWMTVTRRASSVWPLLEKDPPANPWKFPTGLALTEAAMASSRKETAFPFLAETNWSGLDHLRLFCLAFISQGSSHAPRFLERAVEESQGRPGGLQHLLQIAEQWKWETGMVRILHERSRYTDMSLKEMALLTALLEERKDTEALLRLTRRQLTLMHKHPAILNNAAYFSLLLEKDPVESLKWAQEASLLSPGVKSIQATLAFALIRNGKPGESLSILQKMPRPLDPPSALIEGLAYSVQGLKVPAQTRSTLANSSFHYPEEEALRHKLLR